jgi:hypothetical protein
MELNEEDHPAASHGSGAILTGACFRELASLNYSVQQENR